VCVSSERETGIGKQQSGFKVLKVSTYVASISTRHSEAECGERRKPKIFGLFSVTPPMKLALFLIFCLIHGLFTFQAGLSQQNLRHNTHLCFSSPYFSRKEVKLVMSKAGCGKQEAQEALNECDGNILEASMLAQERSKRRTREDLERRQGSPMPPSFYGGERSLTVETKYQAAVDDEDCLLDMVTMLLMLGVERVILDEIKNREGEEEECNGSGPCIYALACKDGYRYVGSTCNLDERLRQHQVGEASAWTRKHPAMELEYHSYLPPATPDEELYLQEDFWTKSLMLEYGIEKVRGGSYTAVTLSEHQLETLQLELRHAKGECFNCGSSEHFSSECPTSNKNKAKTKEVNKRNEKATEQHHKELEAVIERIIDLQKDLGATTQRLGKTKEEFGKEVGATNKKISEIEDWRTALIPRLNDKLELMIVDQEKFTTNLEVRIETDSDNFRKEMETMQKEIMFAFLELEADLESNFTSIFSQVNKGDANLRNEMESRLENILDMVGDLETNYTNTRSEMEMRSNELQTSIAVAAIELRQANRHEQHELRKEVEKLSGEVSEMGTTLTQLAEEQRGRGKRRRKARNIILAPFQALKKFITK